MQHISQDTKENAKFYYEVLPSQKRSAIQQLTLEIKESLRNTARTIWEIGEKLVEARSQLESGQFILWLKLEFGWSQRTAYNFINVYKAFPEVANFAKIDISISALYLLAAPSTPQEMRSQFLNRAIAGEHISYKSIQKAIQATKQQPADNEKLNITVLKYDSDISDIHVHSDVQDTQPDNTEQVKPQAQKNASVEADSSGTTLNALEPEPDPTDPAAGATTLTYSDIRPGWNLINQDFVLFWGDTASPRFIERLPQEAFVLAIPSSQWRHDWLLRRSRNLIVLHQPILKEAVIQSLLSAFSHSTKAVIFPWLPSWKIIAYALKFDIKIYAGDPDMKRCEKLIFKLGLKVVKANI